MRIAITGSCGLLGSATVRQATQRGHEVVAIDRDFANVDQLWGDAAPVATMVADMADADALGQAVAGAEAVIHTASLVDLHLGRPARLFDTNVTGVENLIAACRASKIGRLVHMSSAEVITGPTPLRNITEADATYPDDQLTYYGETKQAGEELVLAAADATLGTCVFRTYGLFGEGDNNVVPLYRSKLVFNTATFIGDMSARTDVIYAGNLAHALVLAAEQLEPSSPWSGSAFHATDHEPVHIQSFLAELMEPLGVRLIKRFRMPRSLAERAARAGEVLFERTGSERFAYPKLTSHSLRLAVDDYWLDASKLYETLGYRPPFTRAEAMERTRAWLINAAG